MTKNPDIREKIEKLRAFLAKYAQFDHEVLVGECANLLNALMEKPEPEDSGSPIAASADAHTTTPPQPTKGWTPEVEEAAKKAEHIFTPPPQEWEKEFDREFAWLRNSDELGGDGLQVIDCPDLIKDLKSFIRTLVDSVRAETKREIGEWAKNQRRTSPNPLKAEIAHNKNEKYLMYRNRGHNGALFDLLEHLK